MTTIIQQTHLICIPLLQNEGQLAQWNACTQ